MAGQYDVVIVGTSAGGGTLANALASAGKILLPERGDMAIPIADVAHQAGTCRFGADSQDVGARSELQGT